jgi:DNA-binding protein HU-beta
MYHFPLKKREFIMTEKTTLTKKSLIDQIKVQLGDDATLTKQEISDMVTQIFAAIKSEIKANGSYMQPSFGTFKVHERQAREGKSPRDPSKVIQIPASKSVRLKVSSTLKTKLNS